MPKWRFRLAADFVAQIQPKTVPLASASAIERGFRQRHLRFECRVVLSIHANASMLDQTPHDPSPWWLRCFDIVDRTEDLWEINRKGGMCKRDAEHDGFEILATRFRDALAGGFFDHLSHQSMLADQCLVCGKALKDPASMARFVGPECAGSSSLAIPRLFRAEVAH